MMTMDSLSLSPSGRSRALSWALALSALSALSAPALADRPAPAPRPEQAASPTAFGRLSSSERAFLKSLATFYGGQLHAARKTLNASQNALARYFANQVMDRYAPAHQELISISRKTHVPLPSTPTQEQRLAQTRRAALPPGAFESVYLGEAGVSEHRALLEDFKMDDFKEAREPLPSASKEIRRVRSSALPMIEEMLALAKNLGAAL